MKEENKFANIPESACVLSVGEFELGDNGENAKTAPVRLVARSGKAISHPYWGNIVHDLSGMKLHKSRVAIDYAHDTKEVVGYLNHFDIGTGDLVTSGALVPFKDSDRATEVIFKMNSGVPYEASINFGGDGIKVQEVGVGELTEVNGYMFEGPGVIVREWPLRGVAICPYGADMYTESASAFSGSGKTFSASVVSAPEAKEEASQMSDAVEKVAEVETPEAETVSEVTELGSVEATEVEAQESDAVEAETVAEETTEEPATASADEAGEQDGLDVTEMAQPIDREEFKRIKTDFGAEIAASIVENGGSYQDALQLSYVAAKAEIDALRERVEELSRVEGGIAVPVIEKKETQSLFNTGK